MRKKPQGKGRGRGGAPVTKLEPIDSFFKFFSPPKARPAAAAGARRWQHRAAASGHWSLERCRQHPAPSSLHPRLGCERAASMAVDASGMAQVTGMALPADEEEAEVLHATVQEDYEVG